MSRTLLFYTSPFAWMNGGKKKSLSSSSFVLSAGNIDLYETEHGSLVKLERAPFHRAAPYNWPEKFQDHERDRNIASTGQ
jgi:hypothetical protein